ncbi:3'-5' exoribonuclease YhaM family protein [Rubinisphaera margarita]|uniref:3'-5' exoribonuclease YhaM family protein n=1 Tax=Rubinisphaera margarita TaxID=2909586 RepID=UPI001EE79933|nr:HD domain-containing protein [Rubinisphaera margarita]MCG6157536.1 HD domain-containing protein [Rubinisphaera margarita]
MNRSLFGGGAEESETAEALVKLSDIAAGKKGECFALLCDRQRAETRDGKPYYRCQFRDLKRTATAMIWSDSSWFEVCDESWAPGQFFRLRVRYTENQYGPQIEIERIREVNDDDKADGFNPADYLPQSRFDTDRMMQELRGIVEQEISDAPLQRLVLAILDDHDADIREYPAASRNHHAYRSGFLEHVLSVTKTAVYLGHKYREYYSEMSPPLSIELIVAGAILHDIGKLIELSAEPHGADYTAPGRLIGHILLGRDMVRDYAKSTPDLNPDTLLRLEHIIVSHQNLPEWGSPVSPHTPEALLVHYADDIDAKFQMMAFALGEKLPEDAEFTSRQNPLRRAIFRGLNANHEEHS